MIRAAFLSLNDANDPLSWSGIPYFMSAALKRNGFQVDRLPAPPAPQSTTFGRVASHLAMFRQQWVRRAWNKSYLYEYDELVLRSARRHARRALDCSRADVVIACDPLLISGIRNNRPVVMWHDATFANLVDFYPFYTNLSPATLRAGNSIQRRALEVCRYAVYSSEWAAESARVDYGTVADKLCVIPYGANLPNRPGRTEIAESVAQRSATECRLLLVGRGWGRKGCGPAVEVAVELNRQGLRTRLTLVGSEPPEDYSVPDCVTVIPRLDKNKAAEAARLRSLFADSHYFLLPTLADCTPLVIGEANAHGLPVLASPVGGIPSLIRSGINGWLEAKDFHATAYAAHVMAAPPGTAAYHNLAMSSWEEFDTRLNWDSGSTRLYELCRGLV